MIRPIRAARDPQTETGMVDLPRCSDGCRRDAEVDHAFLVLKSNAPIGLGMVDRLIRSFA